MEKNIISDETRGRLLVITLLFLSVSLVGFAAFGNLDLFPSYVIALAVAYAVFVFVVFMEAADLKMKAEKRSPVLMSADEIQTAEKETERKHALKSLIKSAEADIFASRSLADAANTNRCIDALEDIEIYLNTRFDRLKKGRKDLLKKGEDFQVIDETERSYRFLLSDISDKKARLNRMKILRS